MPVSRKTRSDCDEHRVRKQPVREQSNLEVAVGRLVTWRAEGNPKPITAKLIDHKEDRVDGMLCITTDTPVGRALLEARRSGGTAIVTPPHPTSGRTGRPPYALKIIKVTEDPTQ